jgi:hypothetical protein
MTTSEIPETEPCIGHGILPISRGLAAELFPDLLNIDECTTQGELKTQGIFEQVQRTLLLPPESYTILGIFYSEWMTYNRAMWNIVIESPAIPLTAEGAMFPTITPVYTHHSDGTNSLLRIDVDQ